jgi:hypothetical protein
MSGSQAVGINPLMPFSQPQMLANSQARQAIKSLGTRIRQLVGSGNFSVTPGQSFNFNMTPIPIGLVTGYTLQVQTSFTNNAASSATLARQAFGPANSLSSINYQNPSGFSPIQNLPGWALLSVMAGREKKAPGAAYTTDTPFGFGSIIQPNYAAATVAAGAATTTSVEYEIPLAYAEKLGNFQGAVWAGTTLSNQSIQCTFNSNFIVSSTTDPFGSCFKSSGAIPTNSITVTWNLYQTYYDQFDPTIINYLTPDLSTAYYLSTQPFPSLAANSNNQVPFINLRTFLSLTLAFDNGGTFNAGTDINTFQLVSGNQLPYWQRDIYQQSWLTRQKLNEDFPAGYYYFDFRDDPIATQAQGNTYLNFNPSTVNSGAVLTAAWEYLAVQQILAGAPAI